MKKTSIIKTSFVVALGVFSTVACNNDKTTPGYTYMDDMYTSPSLETYGSSDLLPAGMEAQRPVEGTIPRGYHPYDVPNTNEGYNSTLANSTWPAEYANMDPEQGKDLYMKFCSHCHGEKGDGNGTLVQREKFLGVPGYDKARLADITPNSIYHVIMYGKNNMGSHASQLTYDERWRIIRYVWKMRMEQSGESMNVAAPATEAAPAVEAEAPQAETNH